MNIVEFYKKLSRILELCREKTITHGDAQFQLSQLLEEAEKSNLDVNVSYSILNMDTLLNYDDEMSYESTDDDSYESSYDPSDYDSDTYESSY